jgi:hypothetical protein
MVNWRPTPGFAVLLRLSRPSPRTTQLNEVSLASSSFKNKHQPFKSSAPGYDSVRDLPIDHTTLRSAPNDRKANKSEHSTQTYESHHDTNTQQIELRPSSRSPIERAAQYLPSNPRDVNTVEEKDPLGAEQGLGNESRPRMDEADSRDASSKKYNWKTREGGRLYRPNISKSFSHGTDPYLVQVLKSYRFKPKNPPPYPEPSEQDLDIENLRPNDVRTAHNIHVRKHHLESRIDYPLPNPNIDLSKNVEQIIRKVEDSLRDETLSSTVVIPRSKLIKLIEQTITVSGAAVDGNNVHIQRHSPTWHRFARLLRTSDLPSISAVRPAFVPVIKQDKTVEKVDNTALDSVKGDNLKPPATDELRGRGESGFESVLNILSDVYRMMGPPFIEAGGKNSIGTDNAKTMLKEAYDRLTRLDQFYTDQRQSRLDSRTYPKN